MRNKVEEDTREDVNTPFEAEYRCYLFMLKLPEGQAYKQQNND